MATMVFVNKYEDWIWEQHITHMESDDEFSITDYKTKRQTNMNYAVDSAYDLTISQICDKPLDVVINRYYAVWGKNTPFTLSKLREVLKKDKNLTCFEFPIYKFYKYMDKRMKVRSNNQKSNKTTTMFVKLLNHIKNDINYNS